MRNARKTIWVMVLMVFCLGLSEAQPYVLFADGGTHTVNWGITNSVWVRNGLLSQPTTLNLVSGGWIKDYLAVWDSSQVNMSGRSIGSWLTASGSLVLNGERVLGTGILSGEWMDGTRRVVNIAQNPPTATILAILDSEHKPVCVKHPRMDFNGDCKVDFADLAIMASSWLECNLVPQSACWE